MAEHYAGTEFKVVEDLQAPLCDSGGRIVVRAGRCMLGGLHNFYLNGSDSSPDPAMPHLGCVNDLRQFFARNNRTEDERS